MALYDKQMCAIQTDDKDLTEWFEVNSNVRQGCIRSSVLFLLLIGFILRTCNFISGWHVSRGGLWAPRNFVKCLISPWFLGISGKSRTFIENLDKYVKPFLGDFTACNYPAKSLPNY